MTGTRTRNGRVLSRVRNPHDPRAAAGRHSMHGNSPQAAERINEIAAVGRPIDSVDGRVQIGEAAWLASGQRNHKQVAQTGAFVAYEGQHCAVGRKIESPVTDTRWL